MCPGNGHSELLTSLCTVQKQKKYITDTTIQGGGDLGLGSREERDAPGSRGVFAATLDSVVCSGKHTTADNHRKLTVSS